MTFTTLSFILFASLVFVIYFLIPSKFRWCVLLAASLFFYIYAGWQYVPFMLCTAIITFVGARIIDQINSQIGASGDDKEKSEKLKAKKKHIVAVAILLVLAILCYSKFTHQILNMLGRIFQDGEGISISVIVPLGISYYTFSSVGYILDVYWKRYSAEKNFLKYLLYLLYFPHILQGPIPRYNKLAPQLIEGHEFDYHRVCMGIQLMLWGYIKKLVIADRLAIFVNSVYGNWQEEYGLVLVVATLLYAVQIYTDFSGCMDIAAGLSQMLGIELEQNFKQPYFAKSVEEYWRRWHITLGKWFKDYLCMPVTVARHTKDRAAAIRKKRGSQAGKNYILIVSSIAVWLATGLWHGTGLNYVIWGIWNGSIIVISSLLKNQYKKAKDKLKIDDKSREWQIFCMVRTFILAGFIPRVMTRAGSVGAALGIFKNMFSKCNVWVLFDGSLYEYGLDRQNFWLGILFIAILFITSLLKEKDIQIRESIAKKNIAIRWIIYIAAFFSIVILGIYGSGYDASAFLYMNF